MASALTEVARSSLTALYRLHTRLPGGLVREEFFAGGTPLVWSRTGGLEERARVADQCEAERRTMQQQHHEHHPQRLHKHYPQCCQRTPATRT